MNTCDALNSMGIYCCSRKVVLLFKNGRLSTWCDARGDYIQHVFDFVLVIGTLFLPDILCRLEMLLLIELAAIDLYVGVFAIKQPVLR